MSGLRWIIASCLLLVASHANAFTTITSTSLPASTTWGPGAVPPETEYRIEPSTGSTFTIPAGLTLTIQPGTLVRLKGGISLSVAGTLNATGTIFDVTPAFTQWGGMVATGAGVLGLSGCTIQNFGVYPADGTIQQVAGLFAANTFVPRADGHFNAIRLRSSTIAASVTLSPAPNPFCYITFPSVGIEVRNAANPVLTIGNNTVIKFTPGSFLRTGFNSVPGGLRAQGVVFTSSLDDTLGDTDNQLGAPAPQQWEGITLDPGTLGAQTELDGCTIRYGGNGPNVGISLVNCEPTVKNCLIDSNYLRGMGLAGTATGANVFNNTFRRSLQCEVIATPQAMVNVVPNNTVDLSADDTFNAYELNSATISASMTLPLPDSGFCYLGYTQGGSSIEVRGAGGPVLTIADGTLIKFTPGSFLRTGFNSVPGGLRARGVVFTSSRDDTLSDTNGDDDDTTPAPQQWEGITLDPGTLGAQTELDGCTIRYGGNGPNAGISLVNCEPTVKNCLIDSNYLRGMGLSGTATGANVFNNTFRRSLQCEVIATPQAMVNVVPNNTVDLSADDTFNAYELNSATISASMTLPLPDSGFCYLGYTQGGSSIEVRGAGGPVLTIADGTLIKFTPGSFLRTGFNSVPGGLRARGVVFTSSRDDTLSDTNGDDDDTTPAPQQWEGITLDPGTLGAQTELDGCTIRYGGNGPNAGISLVNCEPTVKNCLIDSNYLRGMGLSGTATGANVFNNTLRRSLQCEIIATPQAMVNVVPNNTVDPSDDDTFNAYELISATISASMTLPLPPLGFCYLGYTQGGSSIEVRGAGGPVLTIADGTLIKFTPGSFLRTGFNGVPGGLRARGVVFTSSRDDTLGDTDNQPGAPAPQQWEGIILDPATLDAQTELDGCTIRYGGNGPNAGIALTDCEPTVQNCLIDSNYFRGIILIGTTLGTHVHDNVIRANTSYEVAATLAPLVRLIEQNSIALSSDLRFNGYEVLGGPANEDVSIEAAPVGMCFVFTGNVSISPGRVLSVAAGNVFKFGAGVSLSVMGTILTSGDVVAPYNPVVFTSVSDDAWWGDTNGDGASTPAPGAWGRVDIGGANNASRIDGCVFVYGGAMSSGQLRISGTGAQAEPNVRVENSFFVVGLASGGGILVTSSNPRIVACGFRGPFSNTGVQNTTAGQSIDATGNWWGDTSGPRDPSTSAANEGILACVPDQNLGQGVGVTDCVLYRPWLTAPLDAPVVDVPVVPVAVSGTRLVSFGPTPAQRVVDFVLDVAPDERGRLVIFDAAGRSIRRFDLSGSAASRRAIRWSLEGEDGNRVAPGIYLARIGESNAARIVVLR